MSIAALLRLGQIIFLSFMYCVLLIFVHLPTFFSFYLILTFLSVKILILCFKSIYCAVVSLWSDWSYRPRELLISAAFGTTRQLSTWMPINPLSILFQSFSSSYFAELLRCTHGKNPHIILSSSFFFPRLLLGNDNLYLLYYIHTNVFLCIIFVSDTSLHVFVYVKK